MQRIARHDARRCGARVQRGDEVRTTDSPAATVHDTFDALSGHNLDLRRYGSIVACCANGSRDRMLRRLLECTGNRQGSIARTFIRLDDVDEPKSAFGERAC